MPASTVRGETDESLLRDARERAAAVLDALRRDAASLAGDPRWAEGRRLYADACEATEKLIAKLGVEDVTPASSDDAVTTPSETPRS